MSSYRSFTALIRRFIARIPSLAAQLRESASPLFAKLPNANRYITIAYRYIAGLFALVSARFGALTRAAIARIPEQRREAIAEQYAKLQTKVPNAHRYFMGAVALVTAAAAIVPLTASATSSSLAADSIKPSVKHVATATQSPKTQPSTAAKSTPTTPSTPSKAKPSTATSTPAPATSTPAPAAKPSTSTPAPAATTSTPAPAAKQTTQAATPVSTKPYAGVSYASLEPNGTQGHQTRLTPNSSQWENATKIVQAAKDLDMSPYAATIAVATALQESTLRNLTVAVDHDSLGLFQQRPSMGWGSPSQLEDPTYAAKAFLKELPSGYKHMDLADAAQTVQRSFDGSLYAKWEAQAAYMVHTIANS